MKYRKLRIAFSTVCGILCLALIALWVRSFYTVSRARLLDRRVQLLSWQGVVTVNPEVAAGVKLTAAARIPYLLPVLLILAIGGLPWVQWYWGFGLRAMLIVTTLFAVALGVVVAALGVHT